jgi:cytochrome c-type biogenesis protein
VTLAVAFLGGLISCLSPCVLPVIPVFAAFVGGGRAAPGVHVGRARAAGFLLGFAGVFVALWVSLGLFGFALFDAIPTLRPLAGVAIIGLGLATMIGWQPMLGFGAWQRAGSLGGSFLLGAGVAVGWTPCIGPTLGAIITLAAASQTVASGAALLVAYALGMAVPLVVIGVGLSRVRPLGRFLGVHHRAFQVVSGTLIVGVGALVASGAFGRLAGLVPWGF